MNLLRPLLVLISLSAVGFSAPDNFYGKQKEGWYSYEKDPSLDKNKTKKQRFAITPENLKKLNAKQFKELFEAVKEEAFLNPTPESVRSYILFQNYSITQAEKFKDQFRAETLKDGNLDISAGFQTSTFAHGVALEEKDNKRKQFFEKNKDKAGFVVFFDSRESPEKLRAQKEVAQGMEYDYGMKTIFIDLSVNQELRKANKVSATPDVWLIIKQDNGETFKSRVSSGVSDRKAILEGIEFVTDQYINSKKQGIR